MGQALETLKKSRVRVIGKKSSPERLRKFLDAMSRLPVLAEACRQAGFHPTTAKYYIKKAADGDPAFIVAWQEIEGPLDELFEIAEAMGLQTVEAEAYKRAIGYDEPLVDRGRVIYRQDPELVALGFTGMDAYLLDKDNKPIPESVHRQSEDLMKFILERRDPKYMSKQQIDVTNKQHVMVIGVRAKTSAELEEREKQLAKAPIDVEFREVEPE